MNPALSVIAFSTLSGAGYGLALVLALGHGNPAATATKIAWFVALALITIGLLCSTAHLHHPERAWRAFSQWRSSWLSREGCMAVLTYIPLTLLAAMSIFFDTFNLALGYVGGIGCALTVFCTAMIYAQLRTVPIWQTWLTPACYLAFSLTAGTLIYMTFFGRPFGSESNDIWLVLSLIFVAVTWALKGAWAIRAARTGYGTSTVESATGLGHLGKVRLLEKPHAMGNYLTDEMAFRIGRKHEAKFWVITLLLELGGAIEQVRRSDGSVDVAGTTAAISAIIEGWVMERPAEWLWLHDRWKIKGKPRAKWTRA
ncbi:dimethyl sulfoxide reductase anchor subunit, partial [Rhizobiaceae bacterium]|nr:dimethyl sulfoxide reductase anchor subunit [Rhizobiaceae bacterium]